MATELSSTRTGFIARQIAVGQVRPADTRVPTEEAKTQRYSLRCCGWYEHPDNMQDFRRQC